jgi:hypothetical protein
MIDDALRRILEAEAAKVETSADALGEIRRRIAARRRWWLPAWLPTSRPAMFALGTGGLAVATVAALIVGLGSCQPTHTTTPHPQPGGSLVAPASPAPTPSQITASPSGAPAAGTSASLPVYYLGSDRGLPRLYREFHPIPAGTGSSPQARTRAAVGQALDGRTAYDPDYASGWPAGARVRDVSVGGDTVTVDLTGFANTAGPGQLDPASLRQAVQQVIWTATAASGGSKVRLLLDGHQVNSLWGTVPTSGVLGRGAPGDVLGLVWLIDPQERAQVGHTVQVRLYGSAFEATVQLRVRQGTRTVMEQPVTLSAGAPAFGEATATLTLPPGSYVVEAYEVSAADGTPQHVDNHTITVH